MSDFKIVKCTKCDASTAVAKGQLLLKCPQCGHQLVKFAPKDINKTLAQRYKNKPKVAINKKAKKGWLGKIIFWIILLNILRQFFAH